MVGCGGSDVRFAEASPEQLESVYLAASGEAVIGMLAFGVELSGRNDPEGCPAIVSVGQDTTVTGGCTSEDGIRIEGSMAIHNLPNLDEGSGDDPSQPGSIELGLRITPREGRTASIDGRVDLEGSRASSDLTFDTGRIVWTSRLILDCDGACTAARGSEIEVSELGSASVESSWNLGERPSGRILVRGADVLVFDIAGRDEACVPYTIGDKHGKVCPDDDDNDEAAAALAGPRTGGWSRLLRAAMP